MNTSCAPHFCPLRLSIRVPFDLCALHGVYQDRFQLLFARMYFFADFVISSTADAFQSPRSHRHEGEAHIRKSPGGALQRGAALRLFPFASSFTVLKRIVLSPYSCPAARGTACRPGVLAPFPLCRPLLRPFSLSRQASCKGFHLFLFRARSRQVEKETFADFNPPPTHQLRQSVYFELRFWGCCGFGCLAHRRNCQFKVMSLCRACKCCSG